MPKRNPIKIGTLISILKQANITRDEFLEIIKKFLIQKTGNSQQGCKGEITNSCGKKTKKIYFLVNYLKRIM